MANTEIGDVIVPEVFFSYLQEEDLNVNRLIQASPAVVSDPNLVGALQSGGLTFNVPGWVSTENDADTPTNDQAGDVLAATAVTARRQTAVRLERANAWSAADLASQLAGSDAMAHAASKVGQNRNSRRQVATIAALNGLFAATGALNGSHLNDIAEKTTGAGTVAESISAGAIIDTAAPMGDMWNPSVMTMVVHGDTYRLLQKQNLITFQPTAAQDIGFGTYLGMTLVVDDGLPKTLYDTSFFWYRSYLLGPESISLSVGTPRVPVEVEREALQGDGGGIETLVVRDTYCVHPYGTRFTSDTITGETPSNADLAVADNWTQVFADKAVKIMALDHNNTPA